MTRTSNLVVVSLLSLSLAWGVSACSKPEQKERKTSVSLSKEGKGKKSKKRRKRAAAEESGGPLQEAKTPPQESPAEPAAGPAQAPAPEAAVPAEAPKPEEAAPSPVEPAAKKPDEPAPAPAAEEVKAPEKKVLAVDELLSIADLVAIVHSKGWVSRGAIPGENPDESRNSIYYEKPGTGRIVSLQLWKLERQQAISHWNNMLATWPNAQIQENLVSQDTFFWNRSHLFGLVFLDPAKGCVVSVSCHTEICTDTQLLQLALTAYGRLKK